MVEALEAKIRNAFRALYNGDVGPGKELLSSVGDVDDIIVTALGAPERSTRVSGRLLSRVAFHIPLRNEDFTEVLRRAMALLGVIESDAVIRERDLVSTLFDQAFSVKVYGAVHGLDDMGIPTRLIDVAEKIVPGTWEQFDEVVARAIAGTQSEGK